MALHWRPVGPEPAPTYWQRRAVVAVAVLLLLLFLRAVLTGSGGADDTVASVTATAGPRTAPPAASAAPSTSPVPSASPSPSVQACVPTALRLTAKTDREQYPVGGRPQLMLTVTNTGSVPCRRDLGQGAVELLVVSGADRIWSSDDCAPGGPDKQVVLDPGEDSVTRLTWGGRRSLPGCEGDKAQAQAGTYRVNARVGDLRVEGGPFRFE